MSVATPQRGISPIELILAIGATSVVLALAVSLYRTHYVRAQIAASIEEAGAAKALVVAAFQEKGMLPRNAAATGIDRTTRTLLRGPYLDSLEVHDGRLELRFGGTAHEAIAGRTLSLTPFETVDGKVVWICGNQIPGVGLQPLGFAVGAPRAAQLGTSIDDRYLPTTCR